MDQDVQLSRSGSTGILHSWPFHQAIPPLNLKCLSSVLAQGCPRIFSGSGTTPRFNLPCHTTSQWGSWRTKMRRAQGALVLIDSKVKIKAWSLSASGWKASWTSWDWKLDGMSAWIVGCLFWHGKKQQLDTQCSSMVIESSTSQQHIIVTAAMESAVAFVGSSLIHWDSQWRKASRKTSSFRS